MDQKLTTSVRLASTLALPNGARFYRCALQVNPFAYLQRHKKQMPFKSEQEYNDAIVGACKSLGIEVIGVTDHYRISESKSLLVKAESEGIAAFPGFEAVTKDGVHFICLFNADTRAETIERFIGECGVHDSHDLSPCGDKDCEELLAAAKRWNGTCIAAHVATDGGLLKKLSGQTRVKIWKSDDLLACALASPIDALPDNLRAILQNKDPQHRQERPPAIINAQDVNAPIDLEKAGATTFIKMSEVSTEGLRQAFLDPESRIRLNSENKPEPHTEFVAISWEGGFLSETGIHFNENLNVLIGGRGTGKSTVVESIRYVLGLEPLGDDARKANTGVVRQVLRSGTKVSLLMRSHQPSPRLYTIERSVPNPAVVKDETGAVLALTPSDIIAGVEVFGQHEISELTRSPEKLTLLLERFVEREPESMNEKRTLRHELERSRTRILETQRELSAIDERLTALPALEETLKRFKEAGLEEKLKEKSLLVREERVIAAIGERLKPARDARRVLQDATPIDTGFLSKKALEGLPNADILSGAQAIIDKFDNALLGIGRTFDIALAEADKGIAGVRAKWEERRKAIEVTYEKLLRELQKSKIDGAEFIRLRRQIEELRPLRERRKLLSRELSVRQGDRRKLLSDWVDLQAAEYRAIVKAGNKVTRKLRDRVRVEVTMGGNRTPLEALLREEVSGNLTAALDRLKLRAELSLQDLAERCREGRGSLMEHYGLPSGAAERIATANPELFMKMEELELPATTSIELNTAPEGGPVSWHRLDELSTGQKATAVLLLLLLESDAPLVVDQPEDDLDNRFITEGVVPIMRQEKRRRQFVFSTHNANIPVLGDAELILGLTAEGEAAEGSARIAPERMGSIDVRPVREMVEEILEGGKTAFEMRRLKYGF